MSNLDQINVNGTLYGLEPSDAITKSQLAQSVQDSLDKADTALQSADIIDKAAVIIDTASGSIASFPDGADAVPMVDVVCEINPVQSGSGDPSPDNVRPISGFTGLTLARTGKNLFGADTLYAENTLYSTSGLPSDNSNFNTYRVKAIANQSITLVGIPADTNFIYRVLLFNSAMGFVASLADNIAGPAGVIKSTTITPPNDGWLVICARKSMTGGQIELGSTATAYESYAGNTYPISWETEAGTVYGGTLELPSCVLKARPYYPSYNGETLVGPWISSMDAYSPGATPTIGAQVVDLGGAEETYQLDPVTVTSLYGENRVWHDANGNTNVTYRADTKLYIQKINAPADDDMTADTQIASGRYFIIGNTLYLSTTTIPAGDTIIPGTNCIKTDLAAALNALNA